ncbi:MAG: D-amino acid dehydrogenase [Rhodospirillaceae bacterium]
MRVLVLGAGVIGVTSAWYLRRAGHDVTVVERREGAALETSYANGGQISVSHAVPWANPDAPREVLKWLGERDAPLKFRPRADWRQWYWGLRFMLECLPGRTRENSRQILALALESQRELTELRAELAIEFDHKAAGILSLYTTRRAYEEALGRLDLLGAEVRREPKTPDECVALEPALAFAHSQLAGGIYAPGDESGDVHRYTVALAGRCAEHGVDFRYRHAVQRLRMDKDRIAAVMVTTPEGTEAALQADAYVIALGSWSPLLARTLDLELPVYPVKGYSITLPVRDGDVAPRVSITDEEHKLVFSRLGARLRVAGTAELTGYDQSIDGRRCDAILARTLRLFPRPGDLSRIERWAGLRPATPGNVPLIGRTRYANLYLNTGHGTLGWTLACGSAKRLATMLA